MDKVPAPDSTHDTTGKEQSKACPRFEWCTIDHDHDLPGEPDFHLEALELNGIQVQFTLTDGKPNALWSPDFSCWDFSPEEAGDLSRVAEAFEYIHKEYLEFLSRLTEANAPINSGAAQR